jgi:hypothetical protein
MQSWDDMHQWYAALKHELAIAVIDNCNMQHLFIQLILSELYLKRLRQVRALEVQKTADKSFGGAENSR